jgi:hypothetical protein
VVDAVEVPTLVSVDLRVLVVPRGASTHRKVRDSGVRPGDVVGASEGSAAADDDCAILEDPRCCSRKRLRRRTTRGRGGGGMGG